MHGSHPPQNWRVLLLIGTIVIPMVAAAVGYGLFQTFCQWWCVPRRASGFTWVEGFSLSLVSACMVSTIVVTLLYHVLWLFDQHRRSVRRTIGSMGGLLGLSLVSGLPLYFVVGPLANTGDFIIVPVYLIVPPIGWVIAIGLGQLLAILVRQAWKREVAFQQQWEHAHRWGWNSGWLVICLGGVMLPLMRLAGGWGQTRFYVLWIGAWCIGWWLIGLSLWYWFVRHGDVRDQQPKMM